MWHSSSTILILSNLIDKEGRFSKLHITICISSAKSYFANKHTEDYMNTIVFCSQADHLVHKVQDQQRQHVEYCW